MADKYPLKEVEKNFYHMASDQGNFYHIQFKPIHHDDVVRLYTDMPLATVYEIYFDEIKRNTTSNHDKLIGRTIYSLIEDFLAANPYSIVFFITSRTDGRDLELFRVYKIWHRMYQRDTDETRIVKLDRAIALQKQVEAHCCAMLLEKHFLQIDPHSSIDIILSELYPNYDITTI